LRQQKTSSIAVFILFTAALLAGTAAHAQTFTVIHNFTGGGDGFDPVSVTADARGMIYGNSAGFNYGAVYQLKSSGGQWILNPLVNFQNDSQGNAPGPITVASDGSLYVPNEAGGNFGKDCPPKEGCGTITARRPKHLPYGALSLADKPVVSVWHEQQSS
jgi:hypothetical protein